MTIIKGTCDTIDVETGKIKKTELMNWHLMPPAPHLCQECASDHRPELPHNRDSLYYGMKFEAEHGRAPTWTDAVAHCPHEIKAQWVPVINDVLKNRGLDAQIISWPQESEEKTDES